MSRHDHCPPQGSCQFLDKDVSSIALLLNKQIVAVGSRRTQRQFSSQQRRNGCIHAYIYWENALRRFYTRVPMTFIFAWEALSTLTFCCPCFALHLASSSSSSCSQEQDMRERVQKKRTFALERARKEDMVLRLHEDRRIRQEVQISSAP